MTNRLMGELVFLDGPAQAERAGARLRAAGFSFLVTDDDDDENLPTAFAMVWRDSKLTEDEFASVVADIVEPHQLADPPCIVRPDHVPKYFGDFGIRGQLQ